MEKMKMAYELRQKAEELRLEALRKARARAGGRLFGYLGVLEMDAELAAMMEAAEALHNAADRLMDEYHAA